MATALEYLSDAKLDATGKRNELVKQLEKGLEDYHALMKQGYCIRAEKSCKRQK